MKYMELAIEESIKASWKGYIPVGAVLTYKDELIFQGHNLKRFEHVEIMVAKYIFSKKNKYPIDNNYKLYTTEEPCVMCWYVIHTTPINYIYFGTFNKNYGGYSNHIEWYNKKKQVSVFGGICQWQTQVIMESFFKTKR